MTRVSNLFTETAASLVFIKVKHNNLLTIVANGLSLMKCLLLRLRKTFANVMELLLFLFSSEFLTGNTLGLLDIFHLINRCNSLKFRISHLTWFSCLIRTAAISHFLDIFFNLLVCNYKIRKWNVKIS